jgi:hypothetical protein
LTVKATEEEEEEEEEEAESCGGLRTAVEMYAKDS